MRSIVLAHLSDRKRERGRASGTNISRLHTVNILENRAVSVGKVTILCTFVKVKLV